MDLKELRALQAPPIEQYKVNPKEAAWIFYAEGKLGPAISCEVETGAGVQEFELHPDTGGDRSFACSVDMLLQALVARAGVTLKSVATAMGITIISDKVKAEGGLDFRGTLGVSGEMPVGIRIIF